MPQINENKNRVQSLLYLERAHSTVSYSTKPGKGLDPGRLLAGLPAFISASDSKQKTRKTLVISYFNIAEWTDKKWKHATFRLNDLRRQGFTIYEENGNELAEISGVLSQSRACRDTPLTIQEVSSQLKLPADEISLLSEDDFNQVVAGDDSDWEHFAPYKYVNLSESPISQESFERLLKKHGDKIESLTIKDCPGLSDASLAQAVNLKELTVANGIRHLRDMEITSQQLRRLELCGIDIAFKCDDNRDYLGYLLANTPQLEHLRLHDCNVSMKDTATFDLNKLQTLHLTQSRVTGETLWNILSKAVNLITLTLDGCRDIRDVELHDINLTKLEKFSNSGCSLSHTSIEVIVSKANHLKALFLCDVRFNVDLNTMKWGNLTELEELNVDNTRMTYKGLMRVLRVTGSLKKLSIKGCVHLDGLDTVSNLTLGALEELDAKNSHITGSLLRDILNASPQLSQLDLGNCERLHYSCVDQSGHHPSGTFRLEKLKVVNLNDSAIRNDLLKEILDAAQNIEQLDLSNLNESPAKSAIALGALSHLNKLRILGLKGNLFTNTETYPTFQLASLEEVNLSYTSVDYRTVQSLIADSRSLRKMKLIHVTFNLSSGATDNGAGKLNLEMLDYFDASHSNITGTILQSFISSAKRLTHLALANCNSISTGELPKGTLSSLKRLYLDDSHASLECVHALLSEAKNIESLTLQGCDLSGVKLGFEGQPLDLPKLSDINVSNSSISCDGLLILIGKSANLSSISAIQCSQLHHGSLSGLEVPHLKYLSLKGSRITNENLFALIHAAPKLQSINLSFGISLLERFGSTTSLPELTELDLSHSNVTFGVLADLLGCATKLKKLCLYNSRHLEDGKSVPLDLGALEYLGINGSSISGAGLCAIVSNAKRLTVLNVADCHYLDSGSISDCQLTSLTELSAPRSSITTRLLTSLIAKSSQLKSIYAYDCHRLHLDSRKGRRLTFPNLSIINFNGSTITSDTLQSIIENATTLRELSLSNCKHLHEGLLAKLQAQSVVRVRLDQSTISIESLQSLLSSTTSLEGLIISDCKIVGSGSLHGLQLAKLKELYASAVTRDLNDLVAIINEAENIETLDLKECKHPGNCSLPHPNVKFLHLKNFTMDSSIMPASFIGSILSSATSLTHLSMNNCRVVGNLPLSDVKLEKLDSLHAANTTVNNRELSIFINSHVVTDIQVTSFEQLGMHSESLGRTTHLNIFHSRITGDLLLRLLNNARNLEHLSFENCHITTDETLTKNEFDMIVLNKLRRIFLKNVKIDSKSLQSLLYKSYKVEQLRIDSCHLVETHALHDLRLTSLHSLDLRETCISQASLDAIVANASFAAKQSRNHYREPSRQIDKPVNLHCESVMPDAYDGNNYDSEQILSDERQVFCDADTTYNPEKSYTVERMFIGKTRNPDHSELRLESFNRFEFNDNCSDSSKPFVLKKTFSQYNLRYVDDRARSRHPLYDAFKTDREGKYDYFGRYEFTLTKQWQPMPSVSSNEQLLQYYLNNKHYVDISRSSEDGFYYIRLSGSSAEPTRVTIEVLLSCPKISALEYNNLPIEIRNIINDVRGYRRDDLQIDTTSSKPEDYYKAILQQRVGSCRHRAITCARLIKDKLPATSVQVVGNKTHEFIEVLYSGTWISCDLGGYPANVNELKSVLNEDHVISNPESEYAHPENIYTLIISDEGKQPPSNFYERVRNLTTMELVNATLFPPGTHMMLNMLTIRDSYFTADQFNDFLLRTPNIKTLVIKDCGMPEGDFEKIDLSFLTKLEHTTFSGDFIPSIASLDAVTQTSVTHPRIVVEADHLDRDDERKPDDVQIYENQNRTPVLTLKKPIRKLPVNRYFIPHEKLQGSAIIKLDHPKILVSCTAPSTLRVYLQTLSHSLSKPTYYIHTADELQMACHYIEQDGVNGIIRKGPGGPLYDFIRVYPHGTLIINFDSFSASEIARVNTILDEERSIDGTALPETLKVIGLINPDNPDAYNGADFTSRFTSRHTLDAPADSPLQSIPSVTQPERNTNEHRLIELNGSYDWEARLIGSWQISGNQLTYQPGEFVLALREGITKFTFNNPPTHNPDFQRFMADFNIHHGVYHQGRLIASVPDAPCINYAHEVSFPDKDKHLLFNDEPSMPRDCQILNTSTLGEFPGKYQCDKFTKSLNLLPGYIENHSDRTLSLFVTETLTPEAWLTLFDQARKFNTKLNLSLAPNVSLPTELMPAFDIKRYIACSQKHTSLRIQTKHWRIKYPKHAIVIDVSELEHDDLLTSLTGNFNSAKCCFEFTQKTGFLNQALDAGKTVILKGEWPDKLAQAIMPLIWSRTLNSKSKGCLRVIATNEQSFAAVKCEQKRYPLKNLKKRTQITPDFEERLPSVERVLENNPFALLSGATSVGKTYFFENTWKQKYPNVYYGIDQIDRWLLDNSSERKTLLLDEANMTAGDWSLFEGMYLEEPAIFYKGYYYPITKHHKIIFAGNPLSYGGERNQPSLFEHHTHVVEFQPLPRHAIANLLPPDKATIKPILAIYDYITNLRLDDTITAREIIMMARLTLSTLNIGTTLSYQEVARYFAYTLSQNYVPPNHKPAFDTQFKPKLHPQLPEFQLANTVVNHTNRPALHAMWHHLQLRRQLLNGSIDLPLHAGLGGLVIEGESGIGKSSLVCDLLVTQGLIEHRDFVRIPASLGFQEKQARLLDAFHDGKVAIIDEINSSPMLERLLNALLEGHDLNGNPPHKSGFMLIGTQNPISFRGRRQTTLPLVHRLQTIYLQGAYTVTERQEILRHIGVPRKIANDMVAEFSLREQQDNSLCFRDLHKAGKKWVKCHEKNNMPLRTNIATERQVGEVCKLTAIANVEQHFASQLDYVPMALDSNDNSPCILKHAKDHGSLQGEVLEFNRWEQIVNDMGYDTTTVSFLDDINTFTNTIATNLAAGNLLMLAFAVDKETGRPDPDCTHPEKREHASVITGYDAYNDKVTISHWGHDYSVEIVNLFHAAQVLTPTRTAERYELNPYCCSHGSTPTIPKYLRVYDGGTPTITPAAGSGFQSKLLIVKKPEIIAWLRKRRLPEYSLSTQAAGMFPSRTAEGSSLTQRVSDDEGKLSSSDVAKQRLTTI